MNNSVLMMSTLGILSLFMLSLLGAAIYMAARPRLRLKKRLAAIGTISSAPAQRSDGRRQKRIQDKVKSLQEKNKSQQRGDVLRASFLQAGLQADIKTYVIASIITGLIAAAIAAIAKLPLIAVPLIGVAGALGLPKLFLGFLAKKRQKNFIAHFAEAIDVVVRGIRSGLPIGECLAIVSREFEGPVGEEFTLIIEGQKLGLTLEDILERGLQRIPIPEYRFFAIVLQIQKQTGGNLADTLDGLSNVLRDRKKMRDKIKALSSEAKSSAAIIASLPFAVLGMLSLLNPEYVGLLFTTSTGNWIIGIAGFWMVCGIAVMSKMINFEI